MIELPGNEELAKLCKEDGELLLGARHWTGNLTFNIGDRSLSVGFIKGQPVAERVDSDDNITYSGPADVWGKFLQKRPERMTTDIYVLCAVGELTLDAPLVLTAQYYSVAARLVELLREPGIVEDPVVDEKRPVGHHDAPVGRYVHLELGGIDHRVYYEEAGVGGIPFLLQHTAGCHGTQYRHLFENKAVTDKFHLIAYDLPFHGKSIPPVEKEWWREEYKLRGDFLKSVPVSLAKVLDLDRPVFMGCSVGGMLALDLAVHHPDIFSHVISLEGALNVPDPGGEWLAPLWHPQVTNEFKARHVNGIMSPTSPVRYRKETSQIYAAGWPNAFLGDLNYYVSDYDVRETAKGIDTRQCGVDILSGEYDMSGTIELGREAHEAIPGSYFTEMPGMGHFPISENPVKFMEFLQPVLDRIVANR